MIFRDFFHRPAVEQVTPQEARSKQKAGAVIVDVREIYEWKEGHIPGAIHIPLGSLAERVQELDSSRETITVCRSGHRSMSAARILQRAGFSQVSNLTGGMINWMHHQLPIKRK
ncbi:MAG: rhodanese-like domain-containing protein [Ktedonobacteraceae bacterium]|nr:rhodanese-like domain-containing protein [Ktedonobacteraceae bacterium]